MGNPRPSTPPTPAGIAHAADAFRSARVGRRGLLLGVAGLALTACTKGASHDSSSTPPNGWPSADATVAALVKGLQTGTVSGVDFTTAAATIQVDLQTIMSGMDGLLPVVTAGAVSYSTTAATATVPLSQTIQMGAHKYSFTTTATLQHADTGWQVVWSPTIVHPRLTASTRLRHQRDLPARASILGRGDVALVEAGEVYQVGIDKHIIPASEAESDAKKLAALVKVDPTDFAKRVKAAGPAAFVSAITLRPVDVPSDFDGIAGARAIKATAMLAPYATFAQAILGVMGAPTTKQIQNSHGDIEANDEVGLSGLQLRYDSQLRGTPGHRIDIVARVAASGASTPSSTVQATGPSPSSSASAGPVNLVNFEAVAGKPLRTTMDVDQQVKAESVLKGVNQVAALVVLDRATGNIRVAATSPQCGANPVATYGQYAPGSTFKVATSLALLRKGYTPDTIVQCPTSITIGGRPFHNDSFYPSGANGAITLATALANSCNTAYVGQAPKIDSHDLAVAAGSLGVGIDYDTGFASYFGQVPDATTLGDRAADMIGQGEVIVSPMAMAGVAASVASGKSIIPNLIVGKVPTPKGTPLSAGEAAQLQTLMEGVVAGGTGAGLKGLMTGAKTGTAEYNTSTGIRTHAWMIAWNSTYAVASMVFDGETGAGTAGPLITAFFK